MQPWPMAVQNAEGGCALSEYLERSHQRKERPAPRRKPQGKCNKRTRAEAEGYFKEKGGGGNKQRAAQPRRPSAASRTTTREEGPVSYTFVYLAVYESILCSRDQYREERPLIPRNTKSFFLISLSLCKTRKRKPTAI